MKKISIIAPCYNEEKNIQDYLNRIEEVFNSINQDENIAEKIEYEIIFADDNSSDKSVEIIKTIASKNPEIKLIVNRQNYYKKFRRHYCWKVFLYEKY